jgi:hypothetical protein
MVTLPSGTAFACIFVIGSALGAMVPDVANNSSLFRIDPNTTRLLTDVSYTLVFETALPLVAPVVFAASLAFLRTGPRWLGGLVSRWQSRACSAFSACRWDYSSFGPR